MNINEAQLKHIEQVLAKKMKAGRFQHTMGVRTAALRLADQYGADRDKTAMAALFHDYAKGFSKKELLQTVQRYHLQPDSLMIQAHQILHGSVAAAIALNEFGIDDDEILKAIEFHTTGRKNMGIIEKIIYLADFIEEGRDYSGVVFLRELAYRELDLAVYQALTNTMIYVLETGKLLHPNTVEARNHILNELGEKKVNALKLMREGLYGKDSGISTGGIYP
ncbi:bis(5'-nucleosyl)-tetraphosphatase (symmetrical) YqeK [Anoxynatronum buryatiense]|uniref:bis(5'-nucleosyl)-tetraphosphatase (symmetrical) n=1 Tax=Anoxynatronum buryatiense TaxID=489973 RepID=A0AA46AII4_9CLOT|nr:bis(5'-nucleosyl)-tetraphosphatase (symmetrical) YqeK [Anoxynatronum buryatiense]SMP49566.1 putative HD superfamily hydrolase of NAD metabolism [Anoxynatronum buryatiense]